MLQKTETRYKADTGCFIVRKSDQVIWVRRLTSAVKILSRTTRTSLTLMRATASFMHPSVSMLMLKTALKSARKKASDANMMPQ